MKTPAFFLSIIASLFLGATARAELKWEQTTLELKPAIGDKQTVAHFKYENVGKTLIHFKSVKASCGCTTTQTQHDQVAPGEKGEITATMNITGHTGQMVKTVSVETDEEPNKRMVLTLKALIPEMLTMTPTFVFWKGGEDPKPKTISVKAGKDFPVKNISAKCQNPVFEVKTESKEKGEWQVTVKPKATNAAAAGVIAIQPETEGAAASPQTRMFYANVSVTATPPPVAPSPAANVQR
jgi:hypothetical protein